MRNTNMCPKSTKFLKIKKNVKLTTFQEKIISQIRREGRRYCQRIKQKVLTKCKNLRQFFIFNTITCESRHVARRVCGQELGRLCIMTNTANQLLARPLFKSNLFLLHRTYKNQT